MGAEVGRVCWHVTIPGQPWSGNHMYEGYGRNRHKKPEVEAYQTFVTFRVREARPSFWRPDGQIIVRYWFNLFRDIDCTNTIKVIEDAIALALRPEDKLYDRRFLPRAMAKEVGVREPFVYIELEDI